MDRYCLKCMNLLNSDGICTHCHSTEADIRRAPHILTAGSLLRERYLIGSILGQGGFGITYIGRDLTLDMRVAIKEYYPSGFANRNTDVSDSITITDERQLEFIEDGKKHFLKEAQVLAKFHGYPGVVDVRDFFEANNTAYIIMEYLEGQDLRQCIKEKLYPSDTIFSLMAPIMDTLEKIHNAGIIHRDISPDNIMLLRNGTLKLMDFGAARGVNYADQKSLSVVLKAGYAPEEQYRPKGVQGPWTDIYALCATIYKCITGITPDDSLERMFDDTTQWPSQLGKDITVAQERVLQKGMAVKHKDRFQNLGEMKKALLITEEPFSAESQIPEEDPVTVYQPAGGSGTTADYTPEDKGDSVTVLDPVIPAKDTPAKGKNASVPRPQKKEKKAKKERPAEKAKDASAKSKNKTSVSAGKKGHKFVVIAAGIVAVIALIAIIASLGTDKSSDSGRFSSPASTPNFGSVSTVSADDSNPAPIATLAPDEIRAIPSILWGSYISSDFTNLNTMDLELTSFIDISTKYQSIQYHGESYEMSLLPYRVAVDPLLDESIIILTFADRFGETYDLYGNFTIDEANILHIVPCDTEPNIELDAEPLQDRLDYQLKINSSGGVRISSREYTTYTYLINELHRTGDEIILSGAHSGTGAPEIQEVSVEYRSEDDYDCAVMLVDGGITTDAQFTLYNTSSSKISWDHIERRYNGRLEVFDEHDSYSPYYINTYPYGFILIEDDELIPYQNECSVLATDLSYTQTSSNTPSEATTPAEGNFNWNGQKEVWSILPSSGEQQQYIDTISNLMEAEGWTHKTKDAQGFSTDQILFIEDAIASGNVGAIICVAIDVNLMEDVVSVASKAGIAVVILDPGSNYNYGDNSFVENLVDILFGICGVDGYEWTYGKTSFDSVTAINNYGYSYIYTDTSE